MRNSLHQQMAEAEFGQAFEPARAELIAGLSQSHARIAPKYFYDPLGSKLFEAICQLDEYYLTRAEAEIFERHGGAMAACVSACGALIDLGAGNCAKAAGLFSVLRPAHYVAIDISAAFVAAAVARLRPEHPGIHMRALGLDFAEDLALPPDVVKLSPKLFFFPGSSIGNFTPLQAAQFLTRVRSACAESDGILIGIDLIKDAAILEAAYDDALGVTAAFNLNALRHVNALLPSDFKIADWQHLALFNAEQSRVEMHVQARRDCRVTWPGGSREFAAGERIHTENSYKYSRHGFVELLQSAGFGDVTCWNDSQNKFLVCHARAL